MREIKLENISNLLNQVGRIKKKYDDLAEYTGETQKRSYILTFK
jgi:hypothetical protein